MQTSVSASVMVPNGMFMSINTYTVLSFRSASTSEGDEDPCQAASQYAECTFINFHIEVPGTDFIVFRKPVRLELSFGEDGWGDRLYRPELQYWDPHHLSWRAVRHTCPAEFMHDLWDGNRHIYSVDICHLSQFAIFTVYDPPPTTAPPPEEPKGEVSEGISFFIILAAICVAFAALCAVCYWVCMRRQGQGWMSKAVPAFEEMGIRSIAERLPRRAEEFEDLPAKAEGSGKATSRVRFA